MSFTLRNCKCAASDPCNKAIKEGSGVGDDRIRMLVEHMYQGDLCHDVQTSERGFAAEEMSLWTFRELSLWIREWNCHYPNPEKGEHIELKFLDMLKCSNRNQMISGNGFRRHDKAKHTIPVLRGLLPEPANQKQLKDAIKMLSEDPASLEDEYWYLAAAESQPIIKEAGDLEGMKNEILCWVTTRDMHKAKAKIVCKMRGQLLLYGLLDYASQLRDERLNADAQHDEDYSSDEDGCLDELLMELDQQEEPMTHIPQQITKDEPEVSAWWGCCPGADQDDIDNEFLELEIHPVAPTIVASIRLLKRFEYEDQGEWKEHLTHDGRKYYYLVSKEENADGVVEEIPTG